MAEALIRANKGPLTWMLEPMHDIVLVRCSREHASYLLHHIDPTGLLVAPPGKASSVHCGRCDETLPQRLAGWDDGWHRGPRDEKLPPLSTCDRCGKQERFIGGWGSVGQYRGIVCPSCFTALVHKPATPATGGKDHE